jgi:hypothetical protein
MIFAAAEKTSSSRPDMIAKQTRGSLKLKKQQLKVDICITDTANVTQNKGNQRETNTRKH